LEALLKKPVEFIDINKADRNPKVETKRALFKINDTFAQTAQKKNEKIEDAWNLDKNLAINTWNKTITADNFMQVANQMFPAMDFIPRDCMKTICKAQRQAAGENSIDGLSNSLQNNLEATGLLIEDAAVTAAGRSGRNCEKYSWHYSFSCN
jgi:hypothetical protein